MLDLPEGFEFGVVETDEELEELIGFNELIHSDDDPEELRRVIENLPGFGRELNFFLKDTDKGEIVCSLNAIPCQWLYEDALLNNLELGWVGTRKEYRKRGLVRILYSYFEDILLKGDYHISTIQGIPYFYRQFGYDFLLPMGRQVSLHVSQIPDRENHKFSFRTATTEDLEEQMRLYKEHNSSLLVTVNRSRELWELQEKSKKRYEDEFESLIIESDRSIDGYLRLKFDGKPEDENHKKALTVIEGHVVSYEGVLDTLSLLKNKAIDYGASQVRLMTPAASNIHRIAKDYGGVTKDWWKYQLRIPDMVKLLFQIKPVLERRLVGTMFHNTSRTLWLNTYQRCYSLEFENGKVTSIEDIGFQDGRQYSEVRSSHENLVRLIFGEFDIDELNRHDIDFIVSGPTRTFLQTLFPKNESHIAYYMV